MRNPTSFAMHLQCYTFFTRTVKVLVLSSLTNTKLPEFNTSSELVLAVEEAIRAAENGNVVSPTITHERVKKMYTWDKIARRTELVILISARHCVVRGPTWQILQDFGSKHKISEEWQLIYMIYLMIQFFWAKFSKRSWTCFLRAVHMFYRNDRKI